MKMIDLSRRKQSDEFCGCCNLLYRTLRNIDIRHELTLTCVPSADFALYFLLNLDVVHLSLICN